MKIKYVTYLRFYIYNICNSNMCLKISNWVFNKYSIIALSMELFACQHWNILTYIQLCMYFICVMGSEWQSWAWLARPEQVPVYDGYSWFIVLQGWLQHLRRAERDVCEELASRLWTREQLRHNTLWRQHSINKHTC